MAAEFVKIINLDSSERLELGEATRAAVLTVENFSPAEDFCRRLEGFETPVVLALKIGTSENLAAAAHLCVAARGSRVGNLSAEEALKLGFINKVVPLAEVERQAFLTAEKISHLAPPAIRACLRAVNEGLKMSLEDGLKLETELFTEGFSTADMREGTRAFLEKRKPVFRNA